jgi:ABC-type phosphate transport system permease subunit
MICDFPSSFFPNRVEIAWSASLVLVAIVLVLNWTAQFLYRRSGHR